tara:strand:- start:1954 stop:2121 length:168 start_codon:yes stop_codon:yes gene_type:complete
MEILAKDIEGEITDWEEVPKEDLWEDGELGAIDVSQKLFQRIVNTGEWKLIRRKE